MDEEPSSGGTLTRPASVRQHILALPCLALFIVSLSGCVSSAPAAVEQQRDGKYDTAFPESEAGPELERVSRSVRMINAVAYYREYAFAPSDAVEVDDLARLDLFSSSLEYAYYRDTASGTGLALYSDPDRLAFLTASHVVALPDTILFFFPVEPQGRQFVRSVALKERQVTYVPDVEGADGLEVIAVDRGADLAVVAQTLDAAEDRVPPVALSLGNVDDLQSGSFVYVIGFPAGVRMITSGLASRPRAEEKRSFITDAAFNNGFSGGVVLAIKDGMPNLEWIGMASSSAALTEWSLVPSVAAGDESIDPGVPYEGDIYAYQRKQLRYGITICISSDAIRDFLRTYQREMASKGFRIDVPD